MAISYDPSVTPETPGTQAQPPPLPPLLPNLPSHPGPRPCVSGTSGKSAVLLTGRAPLRPIPSLFFPPPRAIASVGSIAPLVLGTPRASPVSIFFTGANIYPVFFPLRFYPSICYSFFPLIENRVQAELSPTPTFRPLLFFPFFAQLPPHRSGRGGDAMDVGAMLLRLGAEAAVQRAMIDDCLFEELQYGYECRLPGPSPPLPPVCRGRAGFFSDR